ncbi:hypothetical protein C2S52_020228 [Perilla frutescens var. hirtella]|nr:hypothetical protein C2S52_020228 [Perilla frutescens var. hirtella]
MVTKGWKPPTKRDEKGKVVLKLEEEYDDADYQIMGLNAKAMNAVFSAVDMNLLTTRFENLRMDEGEKLADFNAKICDIANESFALGDAISEEKLAFAYKVTAIEEAKDVSKMKLQELMGPLRTFEMGLTDEETAQKKSIAFQAGSSSDVPNNVPDKQDLAESIALLIKNFSKFVKRYEKSSQNNSVKNRFSKSRRTKDEDPSEEKLKEVKCRECGGLGHYQAECANTLKKKNKSYSSTLSESDDPDDSGSDEECVSNHIAFMTHSHKEPVPNSVSDRQNDNVSECSDDEEFTEETAIEAYKKLHESWAMVVKVNEGLMKENDDLIKERDSLSMRLNELQNDLHQSRNNSHSQNGEFLHLKKLVKMMNSGSSQLDDIISKEKSPQDHTGLGYTGGKFFDRFCQGQTSGTHGESIPEPESKPEIKQPQPQKSQPRKIGVVCHYCEKPGHIRPYCRDKCLVKNKECVLLMDGDRSRDNCYLLNIKATASQIDEEIVDITTPVPASVPDSLNLIFQKRQNLCKSSKSFSLCGVCLNFVVRTQMADKVASSKPSQAKKPRISTKDLRRQLAELSQLIVFAPSIASVPAVVEPSVASPEAPASVPTSVALSIVSPPRSVSETDLTVQPSPRVSEVPSSPPMVSAEILDASIAAVIENVGGSEVSLAPDEDVAAAPAVGEDPTSIEEFAASLDALKFVKALSISVVVHVVSDTPIVTVQVPLGKVSPPAAVTTLDQGQGDDDVDISFLDEDSPVHEDDSVPPPKAASSKTCGSKRKLELRDDPITPPVSDDGDDTPIAQLKSKVLAKVAVKKPSGKKALAKKPNVLPARRVTRSVCEQRMGLLSGRCRPLMKQARAPSPSDEEAEDVPESVPDISDSNSEAFDSSKFLSAFYQSQFKIVAGCSLVSERCLIKFDIEKTGVDILLYDLRLEKSAYSTSPFITAIVHEFYANLSKRLRDASYEHAFSVFVRGNWIAFSPVVINEFLGRENLVAPAPVFYLNEVVTELTGESRVIWPPGRVLLASNLSVKYSILHKPLTISHKIFSSQDAPDVPARDAAEHSASVPSSVPNRSAASFSITSVFFDRHIKSLEREVVFLSKSIRTFKTRKQELEALQTDLRARALGLASPLDVPSTSAVPATDKPADTDVVDADDAAASPV